MTNLRKTITASLALALTISLAVCVNSTVAAARSETSPTAKLDQFAFRTEVLLTGGADPEPVLSIRTNGTYAAPGSQDCRAEVSTGGFTYTERAVVVGGRVFLDDGDGLHKAKRTAYDFASLCPSDPTYWTGYPDMPTNAHGTRETIDGIKSERFELGNAVESVREYFGTEIPDGMTVDRIAMTRAVNGGWPVTLDVQLTGTTDDACAAMAQGNGLELAVALPCTLKVSVAVTRPNDKAIEIRIPKSAAPGKKVHT